MDKNGLSCFLLGLGVGVGIGMLFAPKSGEETREIIKTKAGEGTDYIKAKAGEGSEYIKQRGAELKDTASGWVDKGKEAVTRQKETLGDAVDAGKQAYRDAVSEAKDAGKQAYRDAVS
jgi:gas vesicle protein